MKSSSLSYKMIPISINLHAEENPFVGLYQINGNIIKKISNDGVWNCIKSSTVLPLTGKYVCNFKIIQSKGNCIEIGIIPQDFLPVENKICDKSIGYHVSNGKLHDTNGDKDRKTTIWRVTRS